MEAEERGWRDSFAQDRDNAVPGPFAPSLPHTLAFCRRPSLAHHHPLNLAVKVSEAGGQTRRVDVGAALPLPLLLGAVPVAERVKRGLALL